MLSVARWNLIRPRDWLRRGFPASPLDAELGILLMPSGNRFQRRRIAGGSPKAVHRRRFIQLGFVAAFDSEVYGVSLNNN